MGSRQEGDPGILWNIFAGIALIFVLLIHLARSAVGIIVFLVIIGIIALACERIA